MSSIQQLSILGLGHFRPDLLFAQHDNLRLSATDIVVLLHIKCFWSTRDQDLHPSTARIVEQVGTARAVYRALPMRRESISRGRSRTASEMRRPAA